MAEDEPSQVQVAPPPPSSDSYNSRNRQLSNHRNYYQINEDQP